MSDRSIRRAAERQIRKAEKKLNQQAVATNNIPVIPALSEDRFLDGFDCDAPLTPELLAFAKQHFPGVAEEEAIDQEYMRQRALRLTALHASTGPRTPAGKETSSRNALKHGSCSTATLILQNESLDDFLALEKRWFQGYGVDPASPETQFEAELIRTAARADWFFQRSDRNYADVEAQLFTDQPNLLLWDESQHRTLARFLRYRTTHTNTLAKQRKPVEDYRKNRAAELANLQKLKHSGEKLAIAKVKLEIQEEKNKPEPTWAEHLEDMRRQAIALGFTPKPRPSDSQ